jgi:tubulin-folding cofactor B
MPPEKYEKKTDSVLAWKKKNKLGRFDPSAPSLEEAKLRVHENEIKARGEDEKRGEIMYVGEVEEIPGGTGKWVGVKLDEPVGKNDGSLKGKRYWGMDTEGGGAKHGVFVRPEKVEVGDWPVLDDFDDMEEI